MKQKQTTPQKPEYLLKAEREQAGLEEKRARLFAQRDAGKLGEDAFERRHAALLRRLAVNEIVLKAMQVRWETFDSGGD